MKYIKNMLEGFGLEGDMVTYLSHTIMITVIIVLCIVANYITKKVVLKVISYYINNNRYKWDNYLLERKVFRKISHVVPAIIIYYSSFMFPLYQHLILKGVSLYMIIVALSIINVFLNAVNDIYSTFEICSSKNGMRCNIGIGLSVKLFIFRKG